MMVNLSILPVAERGVRHEIFSFVFVIIRSEGNAAPNDERVVLHHFRNDMAQ